MPDQTPDLTLRRKPSPDQPLQGQTVLVVEDSRFASEALRLLCLRSGARIRRADSLGAATRHLAAYRPTVAIVDMGLPDGSGLDLVEQMAAMSPRIPVILACSGDDVLGDAAIAAGADGFLVKPIESLSAFQAAVLAHLPVAARRQAPRLVSEDLIRPDPLALSDDLAMASEKLSQTPDPEDLRYLSQFIGGLATTSGHAGLGAVAQRLEAAGQAGLSDPAILGWAAETLRRHLPKRAI